MRMMLDTLNGWSHNKGTYQELSEFVMSTCLADTEIQRSPRPIAHRRPSDGATHDLEEHLRDAAHLAGGFATVWGARESSGLPTMWDISVVRGHVPSGRQDIDAANLSQEGR
jgi:hypothetical protein